MFTVDNDELVLKFNMQKIKTLETMYGISLMSELSKNRGMLSFALLEGLFNVALYNETQEKTVKGQKASEICEALMREVGYADLNASVVSKLQEDMGFLFRAN